MPVDAPEKPQIPDGLKALFDTELAGPDTPPTEPEGNEALPGDETFTEAPAEKRTKSDPPPAELPPEKSSAASPDKKADKKFPMLAPDFSILSDKKSAEIVDVPDMPETPPEHIKSAKAKADYLKWRANHAGMLRQITELQAKAAAPADTEMQTRLAAIQAENEEYRKRVERVDLWSSPAFEREKLLPREKNFEAAAAIVKETGGDPVKLRRALSLQGFERTEALDDLAERIQSKTQRDRFGRLIDQIDEQTAEINDMVANARQANEEYKKRELINRHQNGEKSAEQMKILLQSARQSLENEGGFWILRKSEDPDYEWYNKEIDLANLASEELLLKAGPEQTALGAVLAPHAIRLFKMLNNERAARLSLEQEIAEMRDAGGNPRRDRTPKGDKSGPEGLQGLVRKMMSEG